MPPRRSSQRKAASKPALSLIGFMGSGKSVVGALVAYRAGAPFFDLDFMVETEAGMTISEIFARKGEPAFRALESKLLPEALAQGGVAALGGGTAMNDSNWQLIRTSSTSVYLELDFESVWERISQSDGRPLVSGRVKDEVRTLFEARRKRYEQAAHTVDADRSPDEVATDVLALW